MKRLLLVLISILTIAVPVATAQENTPDATAEHEADYSDVPAAGNTRDELDRLWNSANTAYANKRFAEAAATYDSIFMMGYASHKLYYNMGNAYFEDGKIGRSILFYNRALLLKPSHEDTKFNLALANTYVRDKIDALPEFFLTRWVRGLRTSLGTNGWAAFSLLFLALALASALVYLLAGKISRRKKGFYIGIVSVVLFVVSLGFSLVERHEILHSGEAVVMSSAAPVKSSPDQSSNDLFILHEGTKVNVVSTLGEWREIEIADGNKGWVAAGLIENIR